MAAARIRADESGRAALAFAAGIGHHSSSLGTATSVEVTIAGLATYPLLERRGSRALRSRERSEIRLAHAERLSTLGISGGTCLRGATTSRALPRTRRAPLPCTHRGRTALPPAL